MIKKLWHWINCKLHWHETYSIAEDMYFNFEKLDLNGLSTNEIVALFHKVTCIRCRHCDYRYDGLASRFKGKEVKYLTRKTDLI